MVRRAVVGGDGADRAVVQLPLAVRDPGAARLGEAPTFPAGVRAVREWAPLRERAWATAIFQAGPAFGTATSAVIVGWILSVAGWRMAFAVSGAIGLVWTALWLILFRDPRQARWLSESERGMILAERSPGGTDGRGLGIGALMGYRTMWGLFIVQGCINYTQYLGFTWLPSYLVRSRGLDLMHSGVDLAIIYIGACLLTLLFGRLSDVILPPESAGHGARRYGVAIFCALASVMLAVPYVTSTAALVVVLMLGLTGVQSGLTNNYSLVSDMLHDGGGIGKAVSWLQLGGNIFGLLAPICTGYLLSATGSYTSAFLLAGGLPVLGVVVALTMTRRPIGENGHVPVFGARLGTSNADLSGHQTPSSTAGFITLARSTARPSRTEAMLSAATVPIRTIDAGW